MVSDWQSLSRFFCLGEAAGRWWGCGVRVCVVCGNNFRKRFVTTVVYPGSVRTGASSVCICMLLVPMREIDVSGACQGVVSCGRQESSSAAGRPGPKAAAPRRGAVSRCSFLSRSRFLPPTCPAHTGLDEYRPSLQA